MPNKLYKNLLNYLCLLLYFSGLSTESTKDEKIEADQKENIKAINKNIENQNSDPDPEGNGTEIKQNNEVSKESQQISETNVDKTEISNNNSDSKSIQKPLENASEVKMNIEHDEIRNELT